MSTPSSKPVAIVLDDKWKDAVTQKPDRADLLRKWIGDIVDLRGISFYTLPSLRRGETREGRTPEDIAKTKPRLILLDLDLLGDGTWTDGLQYLHETLRRHPELRGVPEVVISDYVNDENLPIIKKSGIPEERAFYWAKLVDNSEGLREKFRNAVIELVKDKP